MSNSQFNIVLKGVLAGFDLPQAQADFAALFSLSTEKVISLFSAQRAVLKSNVSQDVADKYIARLAQIGVDAVAEEASSESALSLEQGDSPVVETNHLSTGYVSEHQASAMASDTFASQDTQQKQRHQFSFSGSGVEYFKIWIVNILLSIVTLGIYSAWAKVRNKQYFYGNTHIANTTLEYTAEPLKILKGRVIAFALYIAVITSGHISPILSLVVSISFLIFLPWIIVASLRFNARHSTYRHIAFRFSGTVWGAVKVFLGWPILGVFTLGILFPFVWKKQAQYITNNHAYGAQPFHFDVSVKEYYKMLLILIGVSVVFFAAFATLLGGSFAALSKGDTTFDPRSMLTMAPLVLAYIAFYFALGSYVIVTMANIHWNNTKLQNQQFESNWSVLSYLGLIFTNTLGILFTLGLFVPFAKVRAAHYKANHTAVIVDGNLDSFIASKLEESNSFGEGVHDMFDIDISL